jgi:copper homeostasis protein (lipoprotein)
MHAMRHTMRGWTKLWLVVATMAACGAGDGASTGSGEAKPERLRRLSEGDSLPAITKVAAYAGTLPCADCSGIETTLALHPDGSYRLRALYLGKDAPNVFVSVGRWGYRADSIPRVTLFAMAGDRHFALTDALTLTALSTEGTPIAGDAPTSLSRVVAPAELDGLARVRGEFRYFADAATLVACDGGRQYPVTGDSAFIRLQRAFRENSLGTGASVVMEMQGRLATRPGGEVGTQAETFVVDSFTVLEPRAACEASRVRAAMAVGDWQLRALDGDTLPTLERALQPTLRFLIGELGDKTLSGNAGCNRFTGPVVLRGLDLVGRPVAMTRRACVDSLANEREVRYAKSLSDGGWFRLDGNELVLSRGGVERARFYRR